jgi:diguanylate cyclase (GGDEF)-like protein
MTELCADYTQFDAYVNRLRARPLNGERNVYQLYGNDVRYLRIEEVVNKHDTLGVVIDMTLEIEKRRRIESERDVDLLTGLLNRRGIKEALSVMFLHPEDLGHGALFMIDADDLKFINDTYGHNGGDTYLKAIAGLLRKFGSRKNLSARLGGDEYVVFLYGYRTASDLEEDIVAFKLLQDMGYIQITKDVNVLVRFSMGYALTYGKTDYSPLLKEADDKMYENKRTRKKNRPSHR